MFRIKSLQWWTGVLLGTLLILIVAFAYTARTPLCIDSKLIERIDSISDQGTASAYRCSQRKHVDYDANLVTQTRKLGPRLQQLEKYFEWLGPLKSKIHLTVIAGPGEHFRIQGREIIISESILNSEGQLEKAVFRFWFRERAPLTLQSQQLVEESLTDFLYYSFAGALDLQEPLTQISLDQDEDARWPRVLSNQKGYCDSLWKSNEHLRICQDALIERSENEIELLTLRPLITQSLIESYKELSTQDRIEVLRFIALNFKSFQFDEKNFGVTYLERKRQSYYQAISHLENWVYFFNQLGRSSASVQRLSQFFQKTLKQRGFDEAMPEARLDLLVFADALNEKQIQEILTETKAHPHALIGIESKGKIQMGAASVPLSLQLLGEVRSPRAVYFHCGIPKLQELESLSRKIEKLTFINACGQSQFRFDGLFNSGIEGFARQNPKVKFAEFHLPSLILAVEKLKGKNPIDYLKQNQTGSLAPIGWGDPKYDQSVDAYRAQSVIEAIDWYRL
ncbi:MAG: hypothetical protein ACAH59_12125 [Pseudobdellovibrionaceae bacterium]